MKNAKLLTVVMILALAVTFSGCTRIPEAEKSAAKTAMDAAIAAEAPRYAHADFEAAMQLWDTSEAQVQEKKYKEAKRGYLAASAAFEKAEAAVAAGKKALVGEVNADELNAAIARLEADWENLQVLAKKLGAKLEKKKLWEADAKSFAEGLKAAKNMSAADPVSAKLKIDALRPFIDAYTAIFKQIEAAP
ncbi:MAG: hypothetical protein WA133_14075 [Syntrophales bacterium]